MTPVCRGETGITMNNEFAIETRALRKLYEGDVLAVDGIDLAIPTNSVYALLGPNGAGKTTTISMLTTLIQPSGGTATVAGFDVVRQAAEVRARIGVTFQEIVLDPDLTGREALDFHGRLYNLSHSQREAKIGELLGLIELEEAADRRINTYSGGMKRRLELARGLMTDPQVLFLDEPTQGLDPQNRTNIWDYVKNLQEQTDMTILLTTHYMEEAEALADNVGIIDHGILIAEGTPQELISQLGSELFQIEGIGNRDAFVASLQKLPFIQAVHTHSGAVQISAAEGSGRLVSIVNTSMDTGFHIDNVSIAQPTLGDVFLKYTGRQLRDK
jgi:ABC-2 type transport system ATP-binding protein